MRKNRAFTLILILLSLTLQGIFANSALSYKIANASSAELKNMASARALPFEGTDEELRKALLEYEGLEAYVSDTPVFSSTLEILNADSSVKKANGSVELDGNVKVAFSSGDTKKILSAESLVLDEKSGRLTAFGSVLLKEEKGENSALGDVSADIVSFRYESGDLTLSGATTESNRTTSEGESVTFYTSGSSIRYRDGEEGLFFDDGFITSNPKTAYSSISAKNLALLSGGDMFLKDAYLSLGRVPLVYLPFFFYPGNTLTGNPAFGFNSSKGMFLSTSWELFGINPSLRQSGKESSFASLLKSEGSADPVSNGLYYVSADQMSLTPLETWARKSKSYFTLYGDVYQNDGLFLGLDTALNLSSLSLTSLSGMALSPETTYENRFRYASLSSGKYNQDWLSLSFSLPYYSDPTAMSDYFNRLTSFSFDSFLGLKQEFPTTYNSAYTSYTASINGEIKLPKKLQSDLLRELRLYNISLSVNEKWNSIKKEYEVTKVVLPSMNLSASGTIFNYKGEVKQQNAAETEKALTVTERFVLSDPLLINAFEEKKSLQTNKSQKGFFTSLGYSISSSLSNTYNKNSSNGFDSYLADDVRLALTFDMGYGNAVSVTEKITPSYSYSDDYSSVKTEDGSLLSEFTAKSDMLGLEYNLSDRLWREKTVDGAIQESQSLPFFSFSKKSVTKHQVSLKYTFKGDEWSLTPKVTYVLPPLTSALTPSFTFTFNSFTAAGSWKFKGDDLKSDDIALSLSWNGTYLSLASSALYQSAELSSASSWLDPLTVKGALTLQTRDKKYSLSESVSYAFFKEGGRYLDSALTTLKINPLTLGLNYRTIDSAVKADYFYASFKAENQLYTWWKHRIGLAFSVESTLHWDFNNVYNTYLSFNPALIFRIRDFLDISFSYGMRNDSFYRYGSFAEFKEDLLASLDIFGSGRYRTGFTMNSVQLEAVHYMQDWDLKVQYKANVAYSGSHYQWVPSLSIYMKWKTLPDLKVDQNWKYSDNKWTSTGV
jgi:hypothetical protein